MIFQKGSGVPVLFVNPAEALLQTSRWGLGQRRRPSWWAGAALLSPGLVLKPMSLTQEDSLQENASGSLSKSKKYNTHRFDPDPDPDSDFDPD
jgi:hypothetical protein